MQPPKNRLEEGSFYYDFNCAARATKYDSWAHYRKKYCTTTGGAKAVDFIAVEDGTLYLLEAKDYRRSPRTKSIDLGDEIIKKCHDTLAGLCSAAAYALDAEEKATARAALSARKIKIFVHLEQPKNKSKLFPLVINPANLLTKLKQVGKAIDAHPMVFSRDNAPNNCGLSIIDRR